MKISQSAHNERVSAAPRMLCLLELAQRPIDPRQNLCFPENLRADDRGSARRCCPSRRGGSGERARPPLPRAAPQSLLSAASIEFASNFSSPAKASRNACRRGLFSGDEMFRHAFRLVVALVCEIETAIGRQLAEDSELPFAGIERGAHVFFRKLRCLDSGPGQRNRRRARGSVRPAIRAHIRHSARCIWRDRTTRSCDGFSPARTA